MHGLMDGLHITALGMGVVFVGLVLLAIVIRITEHILSPRKARTTDGCAKPAVGRSAAGDEEAVAAIAACLACIAPGRGKDKAVSQGVPVGLVAAVSAAVAAYEEEANACSGAGLVRVYVEKGVVG